MVCVRYTRTLYNYLCFPLVLFLKQRSLTGGCLANDTQLQYNVEFNDTQLNSGVVQDTNYLLADVPQGTGLEITILPALPFLGLTGPPLSSTVNLGKFLLAPVLNICVMSYFILVFHVHVNDFILSLTIYRMQINLTPNIVP